jgi:hypothetical protein
MESDPLLSHLRVIPAKAGIHGFRRLYKSGACWISAFAGMTQFHFLYFMSLSRATLRITEIIVSNTLSRLLTGTVVGQTRFYGPGNALNKKWLPREPFYVLLNARNCPLKWILVFGNKYPSGVISVEPVKSKLRMATTNNGFTGRVT